MLNLISHTRNKTMSKTTDDIPELDADKIASVNTNDTSSSASTSYGMFTHPNRASRSTPDLRDLEPSRMTDDDIDEMYPHYKYCAKILAMRAPIILGSNGSAMTHMPFSNAFASISIWISMLIRSYYSAKVEIRSVPASIFYVDDTDIDTIINSSVVLGIYMWWVTAIRLQVRHTRSDAIRSLANRGDELSPRDGQYDVFSGQTGATYEHESKRRIKAVADQLGRNRANMASHDFVSCAPIVTLNSLTREFNFDDAILRQWEIQIRVKTDHANMCKRLNLIDSLYSNAKREITRLDNLGITPDMNNLAEVSRKLTHWRSIQKSTWHMFHSMPIEFHLYMLLWMEMDDGSDPHMSFVRARPMFVYLYECISDGDITDNSDDSDEDRKSKVVAKTKNGRNKRRIKACDGEHQLAPYLKCIIEAIDKCEHEVSCLVCRKHLISILSGSGSSTPKIDSILDKCAIAICAVETKRRVQNLTKTVDKGYVDNETPQATAVSPILKQIITNIASRADAYRKVHFRDRAVPRKTKSVTRSIVNNRTLNRPYNFETIVDRKNMRLPKHVSELRNLTVYPLDMSELLNIESAHSFLMSIYGASGAQISLSIHVLDPTLERSKSRYLVYDSFASSGRSGGISAGTACIIDNTKNLISFLEASPFGEGSSSNVNVQLYKLSTRGTNDFRRTFVKNVAKLTT
jgi:hypothetical protein